MFPHIVWVLHFLWSEVPLILFVVLVCSGCCNTIPESYWLKSLRPQYQLGHVRVRISFWVKGGSFRLCSHRMEERSLASVFLFQGREPIKERVSLRIRVSNYKFRRGIWGDTLVCSTQLYPKSVGLENFQNADALVLMGEYNGKKKRELVQFVNFE